MQAVDVAAKSSPLQALMRGPLRNLITDVPGLKVGHAEDMRLGSGATAIIFDEPAVGSIDMRGGGPGTRETALLDPAQTVEGIDAIAFSGGSAFGLDAASGVQAWLKEQGRGFAVRSRAGADRAGGDPVRPHQRRRQGVGPLSALSRARLCGGRGGRRRLRARQRRRRHRRDDGQLQGRDRLRLGARPPTAARSARSPRSTPPAACSSAAARRFWAAPFEQNGEFGGRGLPRSVSPACASNRSPRARVRANTTLVVVATDAILTKAQAKRLAVMAQSGLSRAIYPVHTPLDGDVVFAASTGRRALADPLFALDQARRACRQCGGARHCAGSLRGGGAAVSGHRQKLEGSIRRLMNVRRPRDQKCHGNHNRNLSSGKLHIWALFRLTSPADCAFTFDCMGVGLCVEACGAIVRRGDRRFGDLGSCGLRSGRRAAGDDRAARYSWRRARNPTPESALPAAPTTAAPPARRTHRRPPIRRRVRRRRRPPARMPVASAQTTPAARARASTRGAASATPPAPTRRRTAFQPATSPAAWALSASCRSTRPAAPPSASSTSSSTIFCATSEVVLTFDDGPWPVNTPMVIKALTDQCLKATFFEIGEHATWHPEISKMVAAAGMTIGSHTWSHKDLAKNPYASDIEQAKTEIEMGVSAVHAGGRRADRAVLPLPRSAAAAGSADLPGLAQHLDLLDRHQFVRLQDPSPRAGRRIGHDQAEKARQGHRADARLPARHRRGDAPTLARS